MLMDKLMLLWQLALISSFSHFCSGSGHFFQEQDSGDIIHKKTAKIRPQKLTNETG